MLDYYYIIFIVILCIIFYFNKKTKRKKRYDWVQYYDETSPKTIQYKDTYKSGIQVYIVDSSVLNLSTTYVENFIHASNKAWIKHGIPLVKEDIL